MIGFQELAKQVIKPESFGKTVDLKEKVESVFKDHKAKENTDISKPVFIKNDGNEKLIRARIPRKFEKEKIEPVKPNSEFELKSNAASDVSKNSLTVEKSDEDKYNDGEKEKKDVEQLHCRNENLEGKKHPETGVPFERKTVEDENGKKVEGVFPQFESEYDVQLPKDKECSSDTEQFSECNKNLKEAIEKDPKLAAKFSEEQLEQIKNGDTPDGYTWHHSEEKGKMQLVDSDIHAKTGHTGGKVIWGGGSENR